MPRPPILPPIDLAALFARGLTHDAWMAAAEDAANVEKMNAYRSRVRVSPAQQAYLAALPRPVHVIAFAEDWCGDVQRHVPALEALAQAAQGRLRVRYFARTDAPEYFVRLLTNGGEAVPKFVFLSEAFVECGNWGPMAAEPRRLIARGKAAGDVKGARVHVGKLYDADPAQEQVVRELLDLIDTAACTAV